MAPPAGLEPATYWFLPSGNSFGLACQPLYQLSYGGITGLLSSLSYMVLYYNSFSFFLSEDGY